MGYPKYQPVDVIARFGFLGVPVFFCLSGLLIASRYLGVKSEGPRSFAVKRVRRLMPTYWIAVTMTFAFALGADAQLITVPLKAVGANFLFLNWLLGLPPVDPVYWSLWVEFKLYAVVVVLLALKTRVAIVRALCLWLLVTLGLLLLDPASVAASKPIRVASQIVEPQHAPFFCAGIALSMLINRTSKSAHACLLLAIAIVCCVLGLRQSLSAVWRLPRLPEWAPYVAAPTAVFVVAFARLVAVTCSAEKSGRWIRTLSSIAALSYPIYLLHNNIGLVLILRWHDSRGAWGALALTCSCVVVLASIARYGGQRIVSWTRN